MFRQTRGLSLANFGVHRMQQVQNQQLSKVSIYPSSAGENFQALYPGVKFDANGIEILFGEQISCMSIPFPQCRAACLPHDTALHLGNTPSLCEYRVHLPTLPASTQHCKNFVLIQVFATQQIQIRQTNKPTSRFLEAVSELLFPCQCYPNADAVCPPICLEFPKLF